MITNNPDGSPHRGGDAQRAEGGFYLNLFIQSIYASTEAVTISVLAPKP